MNEQEFASQLESYLDSQKNGRTGYKITNLKEVNMGWETELFTLKTSSYRKKSLVEENLVLRVFSGGNVARKASKEYYLMKRLYDIGYPVSPVYILETSDNVIGKPFILMKRVMGETMDATYRSENPEVTMMGVKKLMELLVELHKLDPSLFNEVPDLLNVTSTYYLNYLKHVRNKYAKWLTPIIEWLEENKPVKAEKSSLCHLDFHGMNVMIEDNKPYVIDWGASMICDNRLDLAWTLLLYSTFSGTMYHDLLVEQYQSASGRKIIHLEFYEVVAAGRRIADMVKTINGGSAGLRSDVVDLMKNQKDHFIKVHDFLEERLGFRLTKLDTLLSLF